MECSICLQPPQNAQTVPCCQNRFCSECLKNWTEVKSSCPLCGKQLGEKEHNSLKDLPPNQQFDNGLLYFENELATITQNLKYFQQRLRGWQKDSKNFKSHIPSSHIRYVDDQLQLADEYLEIMTIAVDSSNRQTATLYSQLLTQLLIGVGQAFEGRIFSNQCSEEYYLEEMIEEDYQEEQQENEYFPCFTIKESGSKHDKQRKNKGESKKNRKNLANAAEVGTNQ